MDRNVNDYTFMKLSGKILWLIQLVKNFRDKRLARLHGILPFLGFCFGNAGSWRTLSNSPEKQGLSARCSFLDLTPGHLGRLSEQVPDRNQPAVIAYIFRHFLELFLANKHGVLLRLAVSFNDTSHLYAAASTFSSNFFCNVLGLNFVNVQDGYARAIGGESLGKLQPIPEPPPVMTAILLSSRKFLALSSGDFRVTRPSSRV